MGSFVISNKPFYHEMSGFGLNCVIKVEPDLRIAIAAKSLEIFGVGLVMGFDYLDLVND